MFKVKIKKKPMGSQADYGLVTNSTFVPTTSQKEDVNQTMRALTKDDIKNGKRPTIEVEGDEEVIGDVNKTGTLQKFRFKGKSHAEGGMPVDIPEGSFIYSKKLKMKDKSMQEEFGMKPKKEGYSFSDVAKKYDINTHINTLQDEKSDPFAKRTAQLMLTKNTEALAKLALRQEESKGFPGGTPEISQQVLGVPDMPSQVQELPMEEQQASRGGQLEKYQTKGEVTYTYSGRKDSTYKKEGDKWLIKNESTGGKYVPIKDPKGTRTKELNRAAVPTKQFESLQKEALKKANVDSDFLNNKMYSGVVEKYKTAFASGDPSRMKKAADEIEQSRDLTEGFFDSGFMDIFPGTDSDKFSDIASILREQAAKVQNKKYSTASKTALSDAENKLIKLSGTDGVSPKELLAAKKAYENLKAANTTLEYFDRYHADRPALSEGYVAPSMTDNTKKILDQYLGNTYKPNISSAEKAIENEYALDTFGSDNTEDIPVVQETKPVVKPKVKSSTQASTASDDFESVFDLSQFALGGDLDRYQEEGEVKPEPAKKEEPKKVHHYRMVTGQNSGLKRKEVIYTDGSVELFDENNNVVGAQPAGSYDTKKIPFKPMPSGGDKYAKETEVLKKLMTDTPELEDAIYNEFRRNNPKLANKYTKKQAVELFLKGQEQNALINSNFEDAPDYLNDESWDKGGSDKNKRYRNAASDLGFTPMSDDEIKVFQGMYQGSSDVAYSPLYSDKFRNAGFVLSHEGVGDDTYKGRKISPADGIWGNTTNREMWRLDPNRMSPEPVVEDKKAKADTKEKTTEKEIVAGQDLEKMPDKMPGWYLPDMVNFGVALGQKTEDFRPVKGSINASMQGYTLADPTTQIAGIQSNQQAVQDQIENTTAGNVGLAATLGASGQNAQQVAQTIANTELGNVGIVNNAFAQNAQTQNQQNAMNAAALQKFVQESADFGNNKVKEQNLKRSQVAAMFNAGTEHEAKRKAMEQVLFPQAAMNPFTGDWYVGGQGRDLFAPDTYSPAYGSNSSGQNSSGAAYQNHYKQLIDDGIPEDVAKDLALTHAKSYYKSQEKDDEKINNLAKLILNAKMFGGQI